MKKLLASITAALLLAAPALATFDFYDLTAAHENYTAIMYLREEGIIDGYDDNTYKPEQMVNRAELMKILIEGQGITPDEDTYKECFYDVTTGWFAPYVCYGLEQGWVKGYDDGNFHPSDEVNKVEAAKMLVNIMGMDDELDEDVSIDDLPYDDLPNDGWYLQYLKVLVDHGIPEVTDGNYKPGDSMSRATIAEYLFRVLVVEELAEDADEDEVVVFEDDTRDEFLEEEDLDDLIPSDSVEITHINYKGDEDDESDEYVEITNFGDGMADLEGYTISSENSDETYTFDSVQLTSGESIYVYTNQGDYNYGSSEGVWSNGNDTATLTNADGEVMSTYSYSIPSI